MKLISHEMKLMLIIGIDKALFQVKKTAVIVKSFFYAVSKCTEMM